MPPFTLISTPTLLCPYLTPTTLSSFVLNMPSSRCHSFVLLFISRCRWAFCPQILTWPFLSFLPVSSRILSKKSCSYPPKPITSPFCSLSLSNTPTLFLSWNLQSEFIICLIQIIYLLVCFLCLPSILNKLLEVGLSLSYSVACSRHSIRTYRNID